MERRGPEERRAGQVSQSQKKRRLSLAGAERAVSSGSASGFEISRRLLSDAPNCGMRSRQLRCCSAALSASNCPVEPT